MVSPPARRAMARLVINQGVSQRRAAWLCSTPRSGLFYEPKRERRDRHLSAALRIVAREDPSWGYRLAGGYLRLRGWRVNDKRVYRLWRREGRKVPRKKRKRRRLGVKENGCDRRKAEHMNHVWCWDFVFARTTNVSQIKWLSIVDEYTRECLALKADRSITSEDVIDTLAELFAMRGVPQCVRSDNGPEFISKALDA